MGYQCCRASRPQTPRFQMAMSSPLGLPWLDWPQCIMSGMRDLVQMQPKNSQGWSHRRAFGGCLSAGAPSRMRVRPRLPPGQPWPFACLCLLECLILWHPRMAWVSHSSVVTGESPLSTAATSKGLKVEAARPSEESVAAATFYRSKH